MRTNYQPGPAADVNAQREGDRWILIFVRELKHAPERVWRALTDPGELSQWAPFDSNRDLGATGDAILTMVGGSEAKPLPVKVRRADFPRLLEYTWGEDTLRWELEATSTGTRLTLRHTLRDLSWMPKVATGWHICLDVADRLMAGKPVGRIVADDARKYGWERLNNEYASRLGISSTR